MALSPPHSRRISVWTGLLACFLFVAAPAWPQGLGQLNDWVYVLQPSGPAGLSNLVSSGFDLAVIDYSSDGSSEGEFSSAEISALQDAGMTVLAYLSIGEAETYRYYWQESWNDQPAPDPDAPAWLGPFNPLFPDNYKVRYWHADWQAILFGTPSNEGPPSYLDRILEQGFDGIYLDIVDAFEFWSDEVPERSRLQARQDMVALVQALATYARSERGHPQFLIVPQNGEDVILDDDGALDGLGLDYLSTIDGVGIEDLFFNELEPQPPASVEYRLSVLAMYRQTSKTVLTVDYVWKSTPGPGFNAIELRRPRDFNRLSLEQGFVPYVAVRNRDLDEILVILPTSPTNVCQPKKGRFGRQARFPSLRNFCP